MREGVVDDLIAKHIPRDSYPEAWDIEEFTKAVASRLQSHASARRLGQGRRDHRGRNAREAAARRPMKPMPPGSRKMAPEITRYVEKQIVLQALDHLWREHLVTLDHLRQVVGWRGMAQRDPLNEYKSEAFELFSELIKHLREATTAQLNRVEVAFERPPPMETLAIVRSRAAGSYRRRDQSCFRARDRRLPADRQAGIQHAGRACHRNACPRSGGAGGLMARSGATSLARAARARNTSIATAPPPEVPVPLGYRQLTCVKGAARRPPRMARLEPHGGD